MKALITGASSGIGKALAYELASRGIDLILVARRGLKLKELKKELPVNVKCYQLDLSDTKNIEYLYKETRKENIDILINNAGFGLFGDFIETDINREFEMIDLNIKTVHYMTKLYLHDFVKKDHGYILNVASSAGFMSGPHLSTYYATKNYVCRLDEAIYQELKEMKSNVKISSLCPGPVDTEFNKVAGGTFGTKGMRADKVAKIAIDGMFKGKMNIIPGIFINVGLFLSKLSPKKLQMKIVSKFQQSKINK
jgi:hypothetical protein